MFGLLIFHWNREGNGIPVSVSLHNNPNALKTVKHTPVINNVSPPCDVLHPLRYI